MGLYQYETSDIKKTARIDRLIATLFAKMPEIEPARAKLITESYKETENEPMIIRRAKAFAHILENIPIIIREDELVVGSTTLAPRGCQTYPEFSYEWLEAEFDTVERILFTYRKKPKGRSGKRTVTGKERLPASLPPLIWSRKPCPPWPTICLRREIIFTMASAT